MAKKNSIKLTEDQRHGFRLLANSKHNIFVSGEAGTGKSFLISHFIASRDAANKPKILASTGMAALLIGGQTFHSFFGLGLMDDTDKEVVKNAVYNPRIRELMTTTKEIIIDEVSMLSGRALDLAEKIACICRNNMAPWGGMRIIAVGDFLQLPPVPEPKQQIDWAFKHEVWQKSNFKPVVLKTKMRSKEQKFNYFVSKIRNGLLTPKTIKFLNSRVYNDSIMKFDGVFISGFRVRVDRINKQHLESLSGEVVPSIMNYNGKDMFIKFLKNACPIPESIDLKLGAKVMTRVNNRALGYVNGTVGIIKKFNYKDNILNSIIIDVKGEDILVKKHTFEYKTYNPMSGNYELVASAVGLPINLAYAMTVHKSQGATLEKALLDLSNLWEHGQFYTAISRLKSMKGLYITKWDKDSIRVSKKAQKFYKTMLQQQNEYREKLKKL